MWLGSSTTPSLTSFSSAPLYARSTRRTSSRPSASPCWAPAQSVPVRWASVGLEAAGSAFAGGELVSREVAGFEHRGGCDRHAAISRGEIPAWLFKRRFARASSSRVTAAACPWWQAAHSALVPSRAAVSMAASASRSTRTASAWPWLRKIRTGTEIGARVRASFVAKDVADGAARWARMGCPGRLAATSGAVSARVRYRPDARKRMLAP